MLDEKRKRDFVVEEKPKRSPREKIAKADWPHNPTSLFAMFPVITIIGSQIALSINWRRMGKSDWMWTSLGLTLLFPVAMVFMFWIAFTRWGHLADWSMLQMLLLILPFGLMWGWLLALWQVQHSAYQFWERTQDLDALRDYPYNFIKGGVFCTGAVLVVLFIGANVYTSAWQPRVNSVYPYTVTHTFLWQRGTPSSDCPCLMRLQTTDERVWITFWDTTYILDDVPSLENYVAQRWESSLENNPNIQLVTESLRQFGQIPAMVQEFIWPDDGYSYYVMRILAVWQHESHIDHALEIRIASYSRSSFEEKRRAIEQLLANVVIADLTQR